MSNVICGLLFAVFCFCYLAFLECDYLSFVQHFYSNGRNVSHGVTLPIIATSLLTLLGVILQRLFHLPIRLRAFTWLPSYFLLALCTSIDIGRFTAPEDTSNFPAYAAFVITFLFGFYIALRISERRNENNSTFVLIWPNFLISLIGISFVACTSNTSEKLNTELRVERAIGEERWQDVLDEVSGLPYQSRILTSYCAYALAKQGRLGENFFAYAHPDGSKAFLPIPSDSLRPWNPVRLYRELLGAFPYTDMNATAYLEYISRDTLATENVPDFLLTGYLLDRNLDDFAKKLLLYYPPKDTLNQVYTSTDTIPTHFREALCLYSITSSSPLTSLQEDSILNADYELFDSLYTHQHLNQENPQKFREQYSGTYWYYYYMRQ